MYRGPQHEEKSLYNSMEFEHTGDKDAKVDYRAPNGVITSSDKEWAVVVAPEKGFAYPERAGYKEKHPEWCRQPLSLEQMLTLMEEQCNSRLRKDGHSEMILEEINLSGIVFFDFAAAIDVHVSLRRAAGRQKTCYARQLHAHIEIVNHGNVAGHDGNLRNSRLLRSVLLGFFGCSFRSCELGTVTPQAPTPAALTALGTVLLRDGFRRRVVVF